MAIAENTIYIGSLTDPSFKFSSNKHEIKSISSEQSLAISGEELAIDTLTPEIIFTVIPPAAYCPEMESVANVFYDGYATTDSTSENTVIYCGKYTDDVRDLKYGTPVWWYHREILMGKFYVKNVERTAIREWKINCMSQMGLLDRQIHYGGVYQQIPFRDLAEDIVHGDESSGGNLDIYQAVEYLESDGTAWIETAVRDEHDIRAEITYSFTNPTLNKTQFIFGTVDSYILQGTNTDKMRYKAIWGYYSDNQRFLGFDETLGFEKYEPVYTFEECETFIDQYIDEIYEIAYQDYEQYFGHDWCMEQATREVYETYYDPSRDPIIWDGSSFAIASSYQTSSTRTISCRKGNNTIYTSLTGTEASGRHTVSVSSMILKFDARETHYLETSGISLEDIKKYEAINSQIVDKDAYEAKKMLYLFGANNLGVQSDDGNNVYYPGIRVYSCKIYKDEVLIRDFRPCYRLRDSVKGMFDAVSKAFFESATDSSFTKGSDVSSDIPRLNGSSYAPPADELSDILVTGWLPVDTRRNNLYRLCLAYNVNVLKDDNGDVTFGLVKQNLTAKQIDESRVYNSGSFIYNEPATRVEITEHSYVFNQSQVNSGIMPDIELLYDSSTSTSISDWSTVIFDNAPIAVSTIEHGGNLQIQSYGPNYAIVKGSGYLYGRPYAHIVNTISKSESYNTEERDENVITVEDDCLINALVGGSVLDRLWAYYHNIQTVNSSISVQTEKCGDTVVLSDPFRERLTGYIVKMTLNTSSIVKAECEIVKNYTPIFGKIYTQYAFLTNTGSGLSWVVPDGVTKLYVQLCGAGYQGSPGSAGQAGTNGSYTNENAPGSHSNSRKFGNGGDGGAGGLGGDGGRILIKQLDVTPGQSFSYKIGTPISTTGSASTASTTFGSYSTSSSEAASSLFGIVNIFTGDAYGYKGPDGIKGGNGGGEGRSYAENVTDYNGNVRNGGENGAYSDYAGFTLYDTAANGRGGGASATSDGGKAPTHPESGAMAIDIPQTLCETHCEIVDEETGEVECWYDNCKVFNPIVFGGNGGKGANGGNGSAATVYGCGGMGGHGGGGGGGGGWAAVTFSDQALAAHGGYGGSGGSGGIGGLGAQGFVLIYY